MSLVVPAHILNGGFIFSKFSRYFKIFFFILELHATVFSVSVKHTGVTGRDFRLPPRRN
jgi:hypothetical protein